jgi:hypothetical protein
MLPDMDGWETFEQIRESTDSPAICLSAMPSHQFASQSLKMGEVDYIHKPFYNADLLARVDALVNRTPVLPVYPVVSWGDYSARRPKVSVIIPTLNEAATFLSSSHIPLPVRVSTVILSLKSNRESLHDLQDIIGQRPLSSLYWRSQRQTQLLAQELSRRGHTVRVATVWQGGFDQVEELQGIPVHRLKQLRTWGFWMPADRKQRYQAPCGRSKASSSSRMRTNG